VTGEVRSQQKNARGALICGRAFGGSHVALALRKIENEAKLS